MELVICVALYLLSVLGIWLINHYKFQSTGGEVLFICLTPLVNTAGLVLFGTISLAIYITYWSETLNIEDFSRKFFKLK